MAQLPRETSIATFRHHLEYDPVKNATEVAEFMLDRIPAALKVNNPLIDELKCH